MTALKVACVPLLAIAVLALIALVVTFVATLCWIALVLFGIPGLVYAMVLAFAGLFYSIRTKLYRVVR